MTFSEKISALRKQKGWSQEELAEKLMVTRQAVSKWESAQSMPDLDKLVQLSEALGVSTDYLLKDEQMQSAPAPAAAEQAAKPRRVTQEEAKRFLQLQTAAIPKTTLGVALCVWSSIVLIGLPACSTIFKLGFSEAVCTGIGLCALLLLVGIACLLLVRAGSMRGAIDKLLEQGDYTRESKAKSRFVGAVSAAYWLVVTAAFLFYTFGPKGNGQPQYSWFIWAIAGVLYGALMAALSVYRKKSK